jgi:hypothetical protein
MAWVTWEAIRWQHCERVNERVALEARLVYPADTLPDQPPRVMAHRCSKAMTCNQFDRPTCCWAGTLPAYDPLALS